MPTPRWILLAVAVGALFALSKVDRAAPATVPSTGADYRLGAEAAERAGARFLGAGTRAATFTFAPGTAPVDQQAFLTAVAAARPESRRLLDLVDGLVTVRVARPGGDAVGIASASGGRYEVTVDLGAISRHSGQRGIDSVVLHELGHVVDFALVTDATRAAMDAAMPAGWGCDEGIRGACAATEERFAESFAKWSTGDIGVNLSIGYAVPPPPPAWAEPLVRLGR